MPRFVLLTITALALGACASSDFSPTGGSARAPYEGEVAVLERLPPEGSYELLGVVLVSGVGLTSDARMFERLSGEAAARGADAVVPQAPIRTRPTSDGGEERTLAGYAIRRR